MASSYHHNIPKIIDKIIKPYSKKDTSIEVKIQNFLKQLKIEYYTHQYIKIEHGYQCDILIPVQYGIQKKIIIECDGDYWHGNRELYSEKLLTPRARVQRVIDNFRTEELINKGFRVIRLWEHEIREIKLEDFKYVLKNKNMFPL